MYPSSMYFVHLLFLSTIRQLTLSCVSLDFIYRVVGFLIGRLYLLVFLSTFNKDLIFIWSHWIHTTFIGQVFQDLKKRRENYNHFAHFISGFQGRNWEAPHNKNWTSDTEYVQRPRIFFFFFWGKKWHTVIESKMLTWECPSLTWVIFSVPFSQLFFLLFLALI